jgi:dihydrofolate reductase
LDSEVVMAKLIYSAIVSADGYIEDPDGSLDWGIPDEDLLGFINELERPARTYLYGRRMYEAMLYWERPTRRASHLCSMSSPASGRQPRRSSSRKHSHRCRVRGYGSNRPSSPA